MAVLYSGGADSTLLYYLVISSVMQNYPEKSLDLIIVDRYNNPVDRATTLYNNIRSTIRDSVTKLRFIPLSDTVPGNLQVLQAVNKIKEDYDAIFWGINQYPDDITIRPKNSSYQIDFENFKAPDKLHLPFAKFKKTDIIETYVNLGITDILYNTHSCGEPEAVPCGKCFNCRERIWAFTQLGLEPNLGI
jgi:7-cyano-7-deazaguanine synthase in queuosine biosynthesis